MIRIVLADDHPLIRSGVNSVLSLSGFAVEALVADGEAALAAIAEHRPDVAVLDVKMPKLGGIDVVRRLHEAGDTTPTVLLTAALDDTELLEAIRCGVKGIVLKDGAEDRLIDCLNDVAAGGRHIDRLLLDRALAQSMKGPPVDVLADLAPREREIAQRVGEGMRNREIAEAMGITEGTVKVYLNAIYTKLHLRNRTELALLVTSRSG